MMPDYQKWRVIQLRKELRRRGLDDGGGRHALASRLEEDDAQEQGTERAPTGKNDGMQPAGGDGASNARELVDRIRAEFQEVVGLEVERVNGLTEAENGWQAQLDVVEMSRTPPSTDVLATYQVTTDEDAALASFERIRRFRRSDTEGGTR